MSDDTAYTPRITNVYHFDNGMLMVFDQYGKQMPEYQGEADEYIPKVRAAGYRGTIARRSWL